MTKKLLSFLLLLASLSLACKFFTPQSNLDGVTTVTQKPASGSLPSPDPAAPPPSPGGIALQELVALDPSLAGLSANIADAETEGLKTLIEKVKQDNNVSSRLNAPSLPVLLHTPFSSFPAGRPAQPVRLLFNAAPDGRTDHAKDVGVLIYLTSSLSDQVSSHLTPGSQGGGSHTGTRDNTNVNANMDIGLNADGSSKYGIGVQTETSSNGASAKTIFSSSIEGQRCPDADGKVSFTARVRLGAESGGTTYDQELTAVVTAQVDEDAQLVSSNMDIKQGTRQVKGGREVYVETGETLDVAGWDVDHAKSSNLRVIRRSQEATLSDVRSLNDQGLFTAYILGGSALKAAENNWRESGCIRIDAKAPGKVAPSSDTTIPVKVLHVYSGSEVSAKVKAELSGGQALKPELLPKTPGTLTYTAPAENSKSARISLTATSRRGRATLTLPANTGADAYHISGTLGEASMDGVTCDASQPFTIGGTLTFNFTPADAHSGSFSYTGPYNATGSGTYTIDGSGGMTVQGTGCIMEASNCAPFSEAWTASPIDSGSCSAQ